MSGRAHLTWCSCPECHRLRDQLLAEAMRELAEYVARYVAESVTTYGRPPS